MVELLGHPLDRSLEGKPGLHAHDQDVDHIGQVVLNVGLAALDPPAQPEHGTVQTKGGADRRRDRKHDWAALEQADQDPQRAQECGQHVAERHEISRPHAPGAPGQLQLQEELLARIRRHALLDEFPDPLQRRADDALAERHLELFLRSRKRHAGLVDAKAALDHVRVARRGRHQAPDDCEHAECGHRTKQGRHVQGCHRYTLKDVIRLMKRLPMKIEMRTRTSITRPSGTSNMIRK